MFKVSKYLEMIWYTIKIIKFGTPNINAVFLDQWDDSSVILVNDFMCSSSN